MKTKVCNICGNKKPLNQFYSRNTEDYNGNITVYYHPECKICSKNRSATWNIDNDKRRKEIKEKYDNKPERKNIRAQMSIKQRITGKYLEWQRKNKLKTNLYNINRQAIRKNLLNSLTKQNIEEILKFFRNTCCITGKTKIELDHFIPLSWGHGGSYFGNIIPLYPKLNRSKGNKNPFEWIKDLNADSKKWKKTIEYLSKQNNLKVTEFRDYVYWCEKNKRKSKDIKKSNGETSINLWKISR